MFLKIASAALVCAALLSSCGTAAPSGTVSAVSSTLAVSDQPQAPDPMGAIDRIYESVDIIELSMADDKVMTELMGFDMEQDVEEYYVKYSNSRFGVSDVYIIKPKKDREEQVKSSLEQRREARIVECTNYDVLNSLNISRGGVIFEHGGYVIMLLLEDNESARAIIEEFIPRIER